MILGAYLVRKIYTTHCLIISLNSIIVIPLQNSYMLINWWLLYWEVDIDADLYRIHQSRSLDPKMSNYCICLYFIGKVSMKSNEWLNHFASEFALKNTISSLSTLRNTSCKDNALIQSWIHCRNERMSKRKHILPCTWTQKSINYRKMFQDVFQMM